MAIIFLVIAIYLAFSIKETYNLVSLIGLASFVLLAILMSAHPSKINWRILIAGLEVQFILGVILMRTEFGYQLFKFLSEQVTIFLGYTDRGTNLVFGSFLVTEKNIFAFKVKKIVLDNFKFFLNNFIFLVNPGHYIFFRSYQSTLLFWFSSIFNTKTSLVG